MFSVRELGCLSALHSAQTVQEYVSMEQKKTPPSSLVTPAVNCIEYQLTNDEENDWQNTQKVNNTHK